MLGAGVVEGVVVALEQRHVGVHPGARPLGERLGHEGGVDALGQRDLLDHHPEGHDVVGRGQRVGVAQVDLLLARAALVVGELHRDAHLLQHGDGLAPEVAAQALRGVVEVARVVDRGRRLTGDQRVLEQEELDLGVGVEGEPQVGRLLQRPLQHVPGIGVGRRTVGHRDVAEHPRRGRLAVPPGQHLERGRVGVRDHVGLVDPGEALDRRAVETHALGEGPLELSRGDRHRLQEPENVGKPHADESHVPLFDRPKHELGLLVHAPQSAGQGVTTPLRVHRRRIIAARADRADRRPKCRSLRSGSAAGRRAGIRFWCGIPPEWARCARKLPPSRPPSRPTIPQPRRCSP